MSIQQALKEKRNKSKKLRQIKKSFEYIKYFDQAGIHYQTTNSPDEVRICCPICQENDYKVYVNDVKKYYHCKKCSAGEFGNGDVYTLIAAFEDSSIGQVIHRLLAEYREVTPDDFEFEDLEEETTSEVEKPSYLDIKLIEGLPSCAKRIDDNAEASPYLQYLLDRGLTQEEVFSMQSYYINYGIVTKADGKEINISKRVLWPVWSEVGLTSWLARSIIKDLPNHKPKVINSPGSDMAKCFWPHLPRAVHSDTVIVVEGILDAVAVRRTETPTVCSFGKKLSPTQMDLLAFWGYEKVIIWFDPGAMPEAISAAEKLRLRFKDVLIADNLDWPSGQDAGDMLKHPNGTDILKETLAKSVSINNQLEYDKWKIRLKSLPM